MSLNARRFAWRFFYLGAMTTQAAVVLAAGKGTRMKSDTPKVLHRVCGREMASLVVDAARSAGFAPIVVVFSPDSGAVKEALGDQVTYVEQAEPLGSGHALRQAESAIGDAEAVAVLYADVPLIQTTTLRRMMELHLAESASVTLLTATTQTPDGLGRITRDSSGGIVSIVEDADADGPTRAITEVNGGMYCFRGAWLWPGLSQLGASTGGEVYLTDLVAAAVRDEATVVSMEAADARETLGVNSRSQLAEAEGILLARIRERWMASGVTMPDPATVYIGCPVELDRDTTILPNTHLTGATRIGQRCEVGPNTMISDSTVGDGCRVVASMVESSVVEDGVSIGPFSHIRPGSHLEEGVYVGNFAEVNRTRLGSGTKVPHFGYLGDASVGAGVNVGAGIVTCNYDGERKHQTVIGRGAFIGSDSMLVAPVDIGEGASTAAGSVVTKDVPPGHLAVGAPARIRAKRKKKGGEP